jgi:hypothetical protein
LINQREALLQTEWVGSADRIGTCGRNASKYVHEHTSSTPEASANLSRAAWIVVNAVSSAERAIPEGRSVAVDEIAREANLRWPEIL